MASAEEAVNRISELLANRLSLQEFEDWSASFSWNIHDRGDQAAMNLAYQILAILNEHSSDEDLIREELAEAIRPFLLPTPGTSVASVGVEYGKPSVRSTYANPLRWMAVSAIL